MAIINNSSSYNNSYPDPGENLESRNLVIETGCTPTMFTRRRRPRQNWCTVIGSIVIGIGIIVTIVIVSILVIVIVWTNKQPFVFRI